MKRSISGFGLFTFLAALLFLFTGPASAAVLNNPALSEQTTVQVTSVRNVAAQASSGSWTLTGSLNIPRTTFNAALLSDNRVLVVGGTTTSSPGGPSIFAANSEIYDPATGTWTKTGSLNTPRVLSFQTLLTLPGGKAFVAGGQDFTATYDYASTELFDPNTGRWTYSGNLNTPRRYSTFQLLKNGLVLTAGGAYGPPNEYRYLSSAELFNPATGTWSYTGSFVGYPRESLRSVLLADGRVLMYAGYGRYGPYRSAEIYNPQTGSWSQAGDLPWPNGGPAVVLSNGKVLVTDCGASNQSALYDPATNSWSLTGSMSQSRCSTPTLLPDGKVIIGGTVDKTTEIYDPTTGIWSSGPTKNLTRVADVLISLANGNILDIGGYDYTVSPLVYVGPTELLSPTSSTNQPPTANAGGPYSVKAGQSITLNGSGTDPDGDSLTFKWDLDNNGTFETTGQNASFPAAGLALGDHTVTLQVCDPQSACATASATVTVFVTNGWPQVGYNANVNFFASAENKLRPPLSVKWQTQLGGWAGAPVVANGIVYIARSDIGKLFAFDAESGAQKWTYQSTKQYVSVAAVANGRVFITEGQDPASGQANVLAFDAVTGQILWQKPLDSGLIGMPPTISNGVLYIGQGGDVTAFDTATGTRLWKTTTPIGGMTSPPAVWNGQVFVNSHVGLLYALNATNGALNWSTTVDYLPGWPQIMNGILYVANGTGFKALNPQNGQVISTFPVGGNCPAALAEGVIYKGDLLKFYAYNAVTGTKLWEVTWPENARQHICNYPSVANGVVYVNYPTTTSFSLIALDKATGNLLWTFQRSGTGFLQPPAIADGKLFVAGQEDGVLYALETGAQPPINHPPTANANGPYKVVVGQSITLNGSGTDPDGDTLTFKWDLDNDGIFETTGQNVSFPAAGLALGDHTVTLQVCDPQSACATASATVTVLTDLRIVTESPLPNGTMGQPYSVTLEAAGGTRPYKWSVDGTLPPGLNLNADTGVISGTPGAAGTFGFTIKVTDSSQIIVTKQFNFAPPPPSGDAGQNYVAPISVTDPGSGSGTPAPCSGYNLSNLPPGLRYDPATCQIVGTPTNGGSYTVTVTYTDEANQTVTKEFTITINNPLPTLTSLDPSSKVEGDGGFTLKVNGSNFVTAAVVQWNGQSRVTKWVSLTELTAEVTAADIATAGSASVTVVNPTPGGGASKALTFTIQSRNRPPGAVAGGPYSVPEGGTVELNCASSSDPDGDPFTCAWDLTGGANYVPANPPAAKTITFSAAGRNGPGSQAVGLQVCDNKGACATATATVNITNVAPAVQSPATPQSADEGSSAALNLGSFSDPGLDSPWMVTVDWGDNSTPLTFQQSQAGSLGSQNHTYADNGSYTVKVTVTDKDKDSGTASFTFTVNNVPPAVDRPVVTPEPSNEGGKVAASASFNDPGIYDTSFTCSVNYGDGSGDLTGTVTGNSCTGPAHTYLDNNGKDAYTVTVKVTDKDKGIGSATVSHVVKNLPPKIVSITVPTDPAAVNKELSASAAFTDPGLLDTHTATWSWDDGTTSPGTVTEKDGSGTVSGKHTYTTPGVYTIKLTVTDKDGGSDTLAVSQYLVVYDPNGGFVTGGGWINSPAGAYTADPTMTGRANFGFVSRYLKGASVPTGETEFQFKAGNLNFHSSSYDWLVVAGAKAQYKGTGTINGSGNYGFMLTATDGQLNGGGGVDKFRIKIWDKATGAVVYDNQPGAADTTDPATALAGGSIVIHKS